jgi:predicted metal-dependent enzyme (double-stranded beta helix superfamily)
MTGATSSAAAEPAPERGLGPDAFVARCVECVAAGGGAEEITRLVRRALVSQREQPEAWGRQEILFAAADLLIVDLVLPPFGTSAIHEHGTWAVIGISQGCEVDELFTERAGMLERGGRHELRADDTLVLAPDCIHFIANPSAQPARGIHVYGRHLGQVERRMWDPRTAEPRPMDFAVFEQWQEMLSARTASAGAIVAPAIRGV